MPKFEKTYCSSCGRQFGPGDHGYSHCEDHIKDCIGRCEQCGELLYEGEFGDAENGLCIVCHDDWVKKQKAYWKPLYEGEKQAGLIPDKEQE